MMKRRPRAIPISRGRDRFRNQDSAAMRTTTMIGGTHSRTFTAPLRTEDSTLASESKNQEKFVVRKSKNSRPQRQIGIFQLATSCEIGSTVLSGDVSEQVRRQFNATALANCACSRDQGST